MKNIYKSLDYNKTNEQFKQDSLGLTAYISWDRLVRDYLSLEIKPNEKVRGLVIDENDIKICLETI